MVNIRKASKKLILFVATLLVFLSAQIAGITYAWLAKNRNEINPGEINGYLITDYFDGGTGTEEDPFIITRPIHYFHMAELYQRNSEFASMGVVGNPYCFQIGKTFEDADDPTVNYVYAYDDFGSPTTGTHGKYATSLNMSYYQGNLALLPIGTSNIPFNGELNGQGLEVTNLYIKSVETYIDSEGEECIVKSSDIGIFGYIEGYNSSIYTGGFVHDVFFNNVTIDLTGLDSSIVSTSEFSHEEAHTGDKIYVGYIAGHMPCLGYSEGNGTIDVTNILENVFVNNAKVVGYDTDSFSGNPVSNYGLIGYLDNLGDGDVPSLQGVIDYVQSQAPTPIPSHGTGTGDDTGVGWGASLDMYAIFHRMQRFAGYAYSGTPRTGNFYLYVDAVDDYAGCYYFNLPENPSESSVINLSGVCGTDDVPVEVKDGFFIERMMGSISNYLTIDPTTHLIYNQTDRELTTNFDFETHGSYFYIYTEINETKYYINCNADGDLFVSSTGITEWEYDLVNEELDEGRPLNVRVSTSIGGNAFYITYYNNEWCAVELGSFYNIRYTETTEQNPELEEDVDVFLKQYQHQLITTTDIPTDFKRYLTDVDDSDPDIYGYKYYVTIGGLPYFIGVENDDGTLVPILTDDFDSALYLYEGTGTGLFTLGGDGSRYYLKYDVGSDKWLFICPQTYYLIEDDGNYLALHDGELIAVDHDHITTECRWTIGELNEIYRVIDGVTYYLHVDKTNSDDIDVTISTDQVATNITRWTFEETTESPYYVYLNAYIHKQETDYYLKYDETNEKWIITKTGDYYRIDSRVSTGEGTYQDNFLLINNPSSITASTTDYSEFRKDENNHLYIYINGNKYYLNVDTEHFTNNNVFLTISTVNLVEWIFEPASGVRIPGTQDFEFTNMCVDKFGYTYYLVYENLAWKVVRTGDYYLISDGEGSSITYLKYNEGIFEGTTERDQATKFLKSSSDSQQYFIWEDILVDGFTTSVRKYLNCDNLYPILSSSAANWNYDTEESTFYTSKSGFFYYLVYRGGEWIVLKTASYIEIKDQIDVSGTPTDVYFVADSTSTSISYNQEDATRLEVHETNTPVNPEDIRRILSFDTIDSTYYLKANTDTLDISIVSNIEDATEWYIKDPISATEYQSLYITIGDYQYKLTYNGTKWILSNFGELYFVVHNGNYMSIDNIDTTMDLVATTDVSASTKFMFNQVGEEFNYLSKDSDTPVLCKEGYIFITHSGIDYYLIRNEFGNVVMTYLENPQDATIWRTYKVHDEEANKDYNYLFTSVDYYAIDDDETIIDTLDYYLEYDGEWTLKILDEFFTIKEEIADGFNYLSVNTLTKNISNSNDESVATKFLIDNFNHLYILIDEVPWFLNKKQSIELEITERPSTVWAFHDDIACTQYLNFEYYPTVIGNNWYCEVNEDYYTIKDLDENVYYEFSETLLLPSTKTRWYVEPINSNDLSLGVYLFLISRLNGHKYYLFNSNDNPDENETLVIVESSGASPQRTLFYIDSIVEEEQGEGEIIKGIYCDKFGYKFYISYQEPVWKLKYVGDSFVINDNQDNMSVVYMVNDADSIVGSTIVQKEWYFKEIDEGGIGFIQTIYNQQLYSLNRNIDGTVTIALSSGSDTKWYLSSDTYDYVSNPPASARDHGCVYTFVNGVQEHLYYDHEVTIGNENGWKTKEFEFYRLIKDNLGTGSYIASDGVTLSMTTSSTSENVAKFNVEVDASGKLLFFLKTGQTKKYLYCDFLNGNAATLVEFTDQNIAYKVFSMFEYDTESGSFTYTNAFGDSLYLRYNALIDKWEFVAPTLAYVIKDNITGYEMGIEQIPNEIAGVTTVLPSNSNFTWEYDSNNFLSTTIPISYFGMNLDFKFYLSIKTVDGNQTLAAEMSANAEFYFEDNSNIPGSKCLTCKPVNSSTKYNVIFDSVNNQWTLVPIASLTIEYVDTATNNRISFEPDFENNLIRYSINNPNPYQWYYTGPQTSVSLTPFTQTFYVENTSNLSTFISGLNTNGGVLYTFDERGQKWYVSLGAFSVNYMNFSLSNAENNAVKLLFANYGPLLNMSLGLPYDKTFLAQTRIPGGSQSALSELRFENNEWCMTPSYGQQHIYNLAVKNGDVSPVIASTSSKIILELLEKPIDLVVTLKENDLPNVEYSFIEVSPIQNIYNSMSQRPTLFNFDKIPNTFNTIIRLYDQGVPTNILNVTNDDVDPPDNIYILRKHYDPPETVGFRKLSEEILPAHLDVKIININQVDLILDYNDYTDYVEVDLTTYTPIITRLTDYAADMAKLSDPDSASTINSGYIVSGHNSGSTDQSDITVSYQPHSATVSPLGLSLNGITNAYSEDFNRIMEVITLDKETGEYVRITDVNTGHNTSHFSVNPDLLDSVPNTKLSSELGLNGYENYANNPRARDKFAQSLLADPSGVYGIQFKQAQISMDHIITAHNVALKGMEFDLTKDNFYQMPEDCIDFNVYSQVVGGETINKGTINFFAGTYYSGNEAFFSLHQIERDPMDRSIITSIKEISKIYGPTGSDTSAMYIYEYVGGNTPSLPSGYELVFDMSWLTNPDYVIDNAIYYFEVPVNAGEYALGSVYGKDGAYLMYLDIATMGASEIGGSIIDPDDPTPMLEATPALVAAQAPLIEGIEYRDIVQITSPEDELELQDPLKIFVGYNVPTNATSDNFSIEIKYHKVVADDGYDEYVHTWCKGVYRIYIKNLTASTFDIDVLLVSPEDLESYDYPYAFEFYLWNGTEFVVMNNNEVSYQPPAGSTDYVGYVGTLRRWSNTYIVHTSYIEPKNYVDSSEV